jgi:hypothetical protein
MAYHAFVAMPFGVKKGFDGRDIDFNAVYRELIKPALEHAGFHVFRADEETRGGDIKADMFQDPTSGTSSASVTLCARAASS